MGLKDNPPKAGSTFKRSKNLSGGQFFHNFRSEAEENTLLWRSEKPGTKITSGLFSEESQGLVPGFCFS